MVITGKIFDIVIISDGVAQIVIRKKDNGKVVPIAITVLGYWKDKALKDLKLQPKDKIKANLHLKSKLYNGKYYTDVFFREIYVVERAPAQIGRILFDKETGEVLDESGI